MEGLCISDFVDVIALVVASFSLIISCYFSYLQQKHNKNSVKPIASIIFSDYEDLIRVSIKNSGTGPLIIKKVTVIKKDQTKSDLISFMPHINQTWKDFTTNFEGLALSVNDEIAMISLIPINDENKYQVRQALSDITIKVEYEDVYGTKFEIQRKCDFFGRHFQTTAVPRRE